MMSIIVRGGSAPTTGSVSRGSRPMLDGWLAAPCQADVRSCSEFVGLARARVRAIQQSRFESRMGLSPTQAESAANPVEMRGLLMDADIPARSGCCHTNDARDRFERPVPTPVPTSTSLRNRPNRGPVGPVRFGLLRRRREPSKSAAGMPRDARRMPLRQRRAGEGWAAFTGEDPDGIEPTRGVST